MQHQSTARRQIMVFAMGAMTLVTLATTVIVGAHYWEMLSGVFLIALVGLALPDWAAWWATYWHARATKQGQEDPRVATTCLVVSAGLAVVMILNAGAVMAVWWEDKKAVEVQARNTQIESSRQAQKNTGNTDAIKARGQVVQQMKASGATERTIREYLRQEAERDKVKALTGSVEPSTAEGQLTVFTSSVPEGVKKYMAFWVYIVPFLLGLAGVLAIVVSVHLPGGVEFGEPQSASSGGQHNQHGFGAGVVPATGKTTVSTGNVYSPNAPK